MMWTSTPRPLPALICLLSLAILLISLGVSAETEDGITDLSDDRDIYVRDMAVEGDRVYLVATESGSTGSSAQIRYFNGSQWLPWIRVSDTSHVWASSSAVAVENGTAHIVYCVRVDDDSRYRTEIYHRAFWDGRLSEESRVDQDTDTGDQRHSTPDVVVEGGVVHVVWNQDDSMTQGIRYRRLDQTGWGDVIIISPTRPGFNFDHPKVAAEGTKIHVVWIQGDGLSLNGDVVYREFDGSLWSTIVTASTDFVYGKDSLRLDMAVMDGRVHIVWDTHDSVYNSVYYGAMKNGVFEDAILVSPDRTIGRYHTPSIAVEGEGVAVTWMAGRLWGNTTVGIRYHNGTGWGTVQTLGSNLPFESQSWPQVAIADGRLQVGWNGKQNDTYSVLYLMTPLKGQVPNSTAGPLDAFWIEPEGLDVQWTAEDDYFLGRVSLYYRFSEDNITWSEWTHIRETVRVTSPRATGTFSFVPEDGDGFYQFQTRAEDLLGNVETLSHGGDVTVALDTVAPTGSIMILGDLDGVTSQPELRIGLTYHDGMTGHLENATGGTLLLTSVSQHDPETDRNWMLAEPEIDLTLQGWDGTWTIWMQVRDLAGHVSPVYSVQILLDTTQPNGTIAIADGAHRIATSDIMVELTFEDATSGVVSIRLSNDGVWDNEAWLLVDTTLNWTLATGEGMRSVFLQVLDRAGWVSETVADHVVVDLEAPFGNVSIVSISGYTASPNVILKLEYRDNLSRVTHVRLSNNGTWRDEVWVEARELVSWTLDNRSGLRKVHLQVMDEWGHISETVSDEIILDLEPPRASVMIVDNFMVVNSLELELVITYWDTTTNVERMRLSDSDDWEGVPWEEPSETRVFSLSPGDGRRLVYLQVMDSVGHVSETFWEDVLVDSTLPTLTAIRPPADETQVWTHTEILIIFSEPMRKSSVESGLHLTTGEWEVYGSFIWSVNDTLLSFVPYSPLDEGRQYRLELGTEATDTVGNHLATPLVIEFETEGRVQVEVPTEVGLDPTGVLQILIMIAIAVNVVLAVMLLRRRRRPRRPSEDAG